MLTISLFGKEDSQCYLYLLLLEFKYGTHSVSSEPCETFVNLLLELFSRLLIFHHKDHHYPMGLIQFKLNSRLSHT